MEKDEQFLKIMRKKNNLQKNNMCAIKTFAKCNRG